MSYESAGQPDPIDPALYRRDDVRRILATLDIAGLYLVLKDAGLSQRQIAARTGQSQSEVADIVARRRRVENHYLLKRIATGLGIPPERMGLSVLVRVRPRLRVAPRSSQSWWGPDGTYCGVVTVAELPEGVSAEMFRRQLLVLGATAAFGNPIKGLGELHGQVTIPAWESMPSQLFEIHIVQVRELTHGLREALLDHGSNPTMSSAAAAWADRLLALPGPEKLTRELRTAVAELHAFAAGWAALDAGLYDHALYHYSRALELATEIGDAYLQAIAMACAGLTMLEHRHPDEGLKMLQFAQVKVWEIPPGYDWGIVESCAMADSAIAYACMGDARTAAATVVKSRQLWTPTRSDPRGDQDYLAARAEISRGRLDAAEPFAVASVRRWDGISELHRTNSATLLATIHVRTGESDGLVRAHRAITDVTRTSSLQARTRLRPLAAALESRPGADAKQLAQMARQVATTRV